MKKLPDHLSRECIIAAIRAYDAGVAHQFKSARLYEIEFEGRRYPSKAIVGLAATLATGTEFTPADFSGGIKSKCVRLLLDQGFTIASQGAGDDEVALFPDEGQTTMEFVEGAAMQVVVNRYERDRQARQAALRLHGCRCQVCGLDMASRYGEIGQGFIHIHSAGRDQAGLPSEPRNRSDPGMSQLPCNAAPARSAVYSRRAEGPAAPRRLTSYSARFNYITHSTNPTLPYR